MLVVGHYREANVSGVLSGSFVIHHWLIIVVFQSNAVISCFRIACHIVNRSFIRTLSPCVAQFYLPSAVALVIANDGGRNKE